MSDQTPESKPRKIFKADEVTADEAASPAATVIETDAAAAPTVTEPAVAEPVVVAEPAVASEPVVTEPAVEPVKSADAAAPLSSPQIVYVQAPVPPKDRSNRVVGVLLALLGAVLFAVLYAAVAALVINLRVGGGSFFGPSFTAFLNSSAFWVPILIFAIAFVLLVLIVNRAGWWVHIVGSILVALFVYFGSIGLLIVLQLVATPGVSTGQLFANFAAQPVIIAAALVARETAIWLGLAIAARGRRVKLRNVEARATFDKEQAIKKAEHERAVTQA